MSEKAPDFRQVFEEYYGVVWSFFRRKGFTHDEASDLAQETFLRVFEHLPSLRNPAALRLWVFEVSKNVWRNALRARSAKRAHQEVELGAVSGDEGTQPEGKPEADRRPSEELALVAPLDDPLQTALTAEKIALVRTAIMELPPRMRRCVLLRVEHDFSYREIADILNTSLDTVGSQLHQARALLKAKLGRFISIGEL